MNYTNEIIKYVRRNRVSTTEVADALGKAGVLSGLHALTPDHFRVGRAHCIFTANQSNYALHEQIKEIEEGDVAIVFADNCESRALLGDLICRYIVLYRGAEALIVDGLVRDASRLRRERYPVWCAGATPLGCFNRPADPFPAAREAQIRKQVEGGVAVCDDGGVVVIPPDRLNADMLSKLEQIELQEDIWYYCLNTLKWDTKRIVCDNDYLNQTDLLPGTYRDQLAKLKTPLDQARKPKEAV